MSGYLIFKEEVDKTRVGISQITMSNEMLVLFSKIDALNMEQLRNSLMATKVCRYQLTYGSSSLDQQIRCD